MTETKKKTTKRSTRKSTKPVEEIKNEFAEPLTDGDVIDTSEPIEEVVKDTVMVCSNFPRNIIFRVKDRRGKLAEVVIKGNATNLRGLPSGILPVGAYGITANVPAELWEQIKTVYHEDARIKNGLIFASTPSKARKEAKERKNLRNGFEPIDTSKSETKPIES